MQTEDHIICVHDDHNGNIHIYHREWEGEVPGDKQVQTIKNFQWYFLIDKENLAEALSSKYTYAIAKHEEAGDYIKIYCHNRNYSSYKRKEGNVDSKMLIVKDLDSKGVKTYEADLSSYQRYMIDNDIQVAGKFKILYFDIETDDRNNGIEIGRDQIISFAAYDPINKKTFYKASENEVGLVKALLSLMDKYDVVIGWNSEGFDLPYIKARARKFGLHQHLYKLMGVQSLDLMKKFQETYSRDTEMMKQFRSFSLESISTYFLGYGKIPRESTWEMFTENPDKLREYNIRDVKLLDELEKKTGIVAMSIIKAQICGARLNEKTSGRVLDSYIIRAANKKGVHYESVIRSVIETEEEFEASYIGGHVFTPLVGLHRDVVLFDFSSLYPSIIRTFNISPETYLGPWNSGLSEPESDSNFIDIDEPDDLGTDIGTPSGSRYKGERGVMPQLIHDLVVMRNDMRKKEMPKYDKESWEYQNLDKKQYVYKILANSMYGILGAPFFRYYNRDIAESITRTGHYLTKEASRWFRDQGFATIYGDTDSIFVALPGGDPEAYSSRLKDHLQTLLRERFNIRESFIVMDYKTSFDKFLIVAKKKYVGLQESGKFELTGFEAIKRDTIKLGVELQLELFDKIIKNDATLEEIVTWIETNKAKVLNGDLDPEDITVYKKLTKPPEDFVAFGKGAKLPVHAQIYIDNKDRYEDLQVGAYIPFIITEGKPLAGIHPGDFDGQFDKVYYWNTRIYALLQRVLDVSFPEHDWDQYIELTEAQIVRAKKKAEREANPKKKRKVKVVEL